uniref:Uncharacterized protein n=1 Tax=Moniliophthora roreri TaxID=221103 RepID=A0A0W0G2G6_MONRR
MAALANLPLEDSTSKCEFNGYLIAGLVALAACLVALVLRHYLRSRYPCITVSSLNNIEQSLDDLYRSRAPIIQQLPSYATELDSISARRVILKNRASRIRSRSLELDRMSSPIWKIYLGVHPRVIPNIVDWHNDVEDLERDIRSVIESITQYRFEAQLVKHFFFLSRLFTYHLETSADQT